jgi:hypothetical protein
MGIKSMIIWRSFVSALGPHLVHNGSEERGVVPTGCDAQVDVKMDLGIPHIDTPGQHYNAYPGHSLLSRLFMCAGLQAPLQARIFSQSL